jgi:CheY-like chemotaxis protein
MIGNSRSGPAKLQIIMVADTRSVDGICMSIGTRSWKTPGPALLRRPSQIRRLRIHTPGMLSHALVQLRSDGAACRNERRPASVQVQRREINRWHTGEGSFTMRNGSPRTIEVHKMKLPKSGNRTPKLLIADDDPCVVRALAMRCTGMGFDVETATNGLQALAKASLHKPDILVIDVHIPDVDGLAVCAYVLDQASHSMNVIVMTGHPDPKMAEWCEAAGALYIHKGINFWNEFEAALCATFPAQATEIGQADRQTPKPEIRTHPRVLVVDDDVNVRKFISSKLENLGVEPLFSSDGTRGFWKALHEEPTVIVSDYYMRNGDAEYLLLRLRVAPETRHIPVIVQSGRPLDSPTKQRLRQQICGHPGAARILQKSFGAEELLEAIQGFCSFVTTPVADFR